MNATFNIRRLGLTIRKELQEKYLTILGTIGIMLLLYLLGWAVSLLDGVPVMAESRAKSAISGLTIIVCLAPFILYSNENRRMEGVFYAVSPSSTLEKTISMFIVSSVIFTLLVTVMLLSLDSLLTLIPVSSRYTGNIWGEMFSSKEYLSSLATGMNLNTVDTDLVNRIYDMIDPFMISPVLGLILGQSPFIFLNMLFRNHKIGYTLLVILSIMILSTIAAVIGAVHFFDEMQYSGNVEPGLIFNWMATWYKSIFLFMAYVLPVILWVLTYFRIRRIQY